MARPAVIVSDGMTAMPRRPVATAVMAAPRGGEPRDTEPPAANLFGADLVSERSLDEVILAYLAEDLPLK